MPTKAKAPIPKPSHRRIPTRFITPIDTPPSTPTVFGHTASRCTVQALRGCAETKHPSRRFGCHIHAIRRLILSHSVAKRLSTGATARGPRPRKSTRRRQQTKHSPPSGKQPIPLAPDFLFARQQFQRPTGAGSGPSAAAPFGWRPCRPLRFQNWRSSSPNNSTTRRSMILSCASLRPSIDSRSRFTSSSIRFSSSILRS